MIQSIQKLAARIPQRWLAIAAIIGGLFWIIKGVAILLTGEQPIFLFEAAPFFFLLALLGLNRLLTVRHPLRTVALWLIYISLISTALLALIALFLPSLFPESEEFAFPVSLLIMLSSVGWIVGLWCLGWVSYKSLRDSWNWYRLPLAMGLLGPIVIIIGAILVSINERLLEVPLVLYACGWIFFGYVLLQTNFEKSNK